MVKKIAWLDTRIKRKLPLTIDAVSEFCDDIFMTYTDIPATDEMRHTIAKGIMHLLPDQTKASKNHLAAFCYRQMANGAAYEYLREVTASMKKALEEKSAAIAPKPETLGKP